MSETPVGAEHLEFEAWYREEHRALVAWLAVVASDQGLAEDAAAEAFARAFARWDRVREMDSPTGWTYTVALNVVRRQVRRRAVEERLLHRSAARQPPHTETISPEVWAAVAALPLRQRTAIALRYVLDMSQADIADLMGIAPGTVSATLTAARSRLSKVLGEPQERIEVDREAR
jgi:RNA polymerase sigma factor (sigma-70 family)